MDGDRRARVAASATHNGIDFVEVASADQTGLRVHFLNAVPVTLAGPPTITGGESIPTVAVRPITSADWVVVAGHQVLTLRVAAPGDFSSYTLTLAGAALDPVLRRAGFSFKARCATDFDCARRPPSCPAPDRAPPPIDYLAKDFLGFRQALLDFSARAYPAWVERSEADFGMMALEALCALADDLSYQQDRLHAEGFFPTATQRRSVVRHARLVDYEPRPASAARVLLRLTVDRAVAVPAGLPVGATGPGGEPIDFEVGRSLVDPASGLARAPESFVTDPAWNAIGPYWWDDAGRCLRAGATEMTVRGHDLHLQPGQLLLVETQPATPGDPPLRELIRLVPDEPPAQDLDPLPGPAGAGLPVPAPVTRLRWETPLAADYDLTRTVLAGNLVPATQGRTVRGEAFAIPGAGPIDPHLRPALWRTGPRRDDGTTADLYLYPLREGPLAWLEPEDGGRPVPEVVLNERTAADPKPWTWVRWLLDAGRYDPAFTVDPVRYRPVGTNADGSTSYDYDGDDGETLRFGDDSFGATPRDGAVYDLVYRVGAQAAGNVAADAITRFDPAQAPGVVSVSNPFPAAAGAAAESLERVRRLAPQAFQAVSYRAVRPEDYRRTAEELAWVQRAGASFRWTGSWLTGFVAVDPRGGRAPAAAQQRELIDLLNRRRMAGYEVYTPPPRYAPLDLHVEVCARPEAFAGHVEEAVQAALAAAPPGFFDPDRFTFGTPLRRSALEDAVQRAPGVAGVVCIRYRRRGRVPQFVAMPEEVAVGPDEIIQVANDPSRPERGSLKVVAGGGR
jgi:hypothetical protein